MPTDPLSLVLLLSITAKAARLALIASIGQSIKSPTTATAELKAAEFTDEFSVTFLDLILQSIFQKSDKDSLGALLASVDFQRRNALARSMIQLKAALAIEPNTEEELRFKVDRYRQALESLDEAEAAARDSEMMLVMILKATVQAVLPGAIQGARLDAERAIKLLSKNAAAIELEIQLNEQKIVAHQRTLTRLGPAKRWPAGGGSLAAWSSGDSALERGIYKSKLTGREMHRDDLNEKLQEIRALEQAMRTITSLA